MALEKASVVKAKGLLRADEVRSEIERKKRERQWHVEFHKRIDHVLAHDVVQAILESIDSNKLVENPTYDLSIPKNCSTIYASDRFRTRTNACGLFESDKSEASAVSRAQIELTEKLLINTLLEYGYRVADRDCENDESWFCNGMILFCLPSANPNWPTRRFREHLRVVI